MKKVERKEFEAHLDQDNRVHELEAVRFVVSRDGEESTGFVTRIPAPRPGEAEVHIYELGEEGRSLVYSGPCHVVWVKGERLTEQPFGLPYEVGFVLEGER